jgi:tRNA uridine 5-carbamoylmethylation protein Kti12
MSTSNTVTVLLLVGLPASGKSTLANKLKKVYELGIHDAVIQQGDYSQINPTTASTTPTLTTSAKPIRKRGRFVYIEYDAIEESLLLNHTSTISHNRTKVDQDINDKATSASFERQQQQQQQQHQREAWNQARVVAMETLQQELDATITSCSSATNATTLAGQQQQPTTDGLATNGSSSRTIILLDDNFHLRGMRKQIHRLLLRYHTDDTENETKSIRIQFGILWVTCSMEICLERNRKRNQQQQQQRRRRRVVSDQIIRTMNETLEPPTRSAWEVGNTLIISQDTTLASTVNFVEHCPDIVEKVIPPNLLPVDKEQQTIDRTNTLTNPMHQLDQLLRQWVGQTAKYDQRYAKAANLARRELLLSQKTTSNREGFVLCGTDTSKTMMDGLKDDFLDLLVPPGIASWQLRSHLRDALS